MQQINKSAPKDCDSNFTCPYCDSKNSQAQPSSYHFEIIDSLTNAVVTNIVLFLTLFANLSCKLKLMKKLEFYLLHSSAQELKK